ncbi:hypothetical protein BsWGS_12593 [Bradybaena similaris]
MMNMFPVFPDRPLTVEQMVAAANQSVTCVVMFQILSSNWFTATPPIQARDGDVGLNTKLTYSLQSVTPNLSLLINNDTGQVKVLEQLDREQIPAYTIIVKVSTLSTHAAKWMC